MREIEALRIPSVDGGPATNPYDASANRMLDRVVGLLRQGPTVTLAGLNNLIEGPVELVMEAHDPEARWAMGTDYALVELGDTA